MSKENGEIDREYINSIQKSPKWIIERAIEKFKNFSTQAEIQEMLIGVTLMPDNEMDNGSISKTKWRPMYVPESVLDQAINNQNFGEDQVVALKIGYKKLFDSLGKNLLYFAKGSIVKMAELNVEYQRYRVRNPHMNLHLYISPRKSMSQTDLYQC